MNNRLLAPSLLAADFGRLAEAVQKIEKGGGDVAHIDVMDGSFVPEVSFGQVVVRSLRPLTKLPFDVHLMVQNPEKQIESFAQAGADWITFHYEAARDSGEDSVQLLKKIRSLGKKSRHKRKTRHKRRCIEEFAGICRYYIDNDCRAGLWRAKAYSRMFGQG